MLRSPQWLTRIFHKSPTSEPHVDNSSSQELIQNSSLLSRPVPSLGEGSGLNEVPAATANDESEEGKVSHAKSTTEPVAPDPSEDLDEQTDPKDIQDDATYLLGLREEVNVPEQDEDVTQKSSAALQQPIETPHTTHDEPRALKGTETVDQNLTPTINYECDSSIMKSHNMNTSRKRRRSAAANTNCTLESPTLISSRRYSERDAQGKFVLDPRPTENALRKRRRREQLRAAQQKATVSSDSVTKQSLLKKEPSTEALKSRKHPERMRARCERSDISRSRGLTSRGKTLHSSDKLNGKSLVKPNDVDFEHDEESHRLGTQSRRSRKKPRFRTRDESSQELKRQHCPRNITTSETEDHGSEMDPLSDIELLNTAEEACVALIKSNHENEAYALRRISEHSKTNANMSDLLNALMSVDMAAAVIQDNTIEASRDLSWEHQSKWENLVKNQATVANAISRNPNEYNRPVGTPQSHVCVLVPKDANAGFDTPSVANSPSASRGISANTLGSNNGNIVRRTAVGAHAQPQRAIKNYSDGEGSDDGSVETGMVAAAPLAQHKSFGDLVSVTSSEDLGEDDEKHSTIDNLEKRIGSPELGSLHEHIATQDGRFDSLGVRKKQQKCRATGDAHPSNNEALTPKFVGHEERSLSMVEQPRKETDTPGKIRCKTRRQRRRARKEREKLEQDPQMQVTNVCISQSPSRSVKRSAAPGQLTHTEEGEPVATILELSHEPSTSNQRHADNYKRSKKRQVNEETETGHGLGSPGPDGHRRKRKKHKHNLPASPADIKHHKQLKHVEEREKIDTEPLLAQYTVNCATFEPLTSNQQDLMRVQQGRGKLTPVSPETKAEPLRSTPRSMNTQKFFSDRQAGGTSDKHDSKKALTTALGSRSFESDGRW